MNATTLEKPEVLELAKAQETINNGLESFDQKKAELEEMARIYKGTTVDSIDDRAGLKIVSDARKRLKAERVSLTNQGKSMRDKLTVVSRFISAREKELVGIIEPVEDELQAEEDRIEAEKEKIRKDAEERENARVQARLDVLMAYGFEMDYMTIKTMPQPDFDKVVESAKSQFEQAEAEKAEAERIKLEAEAKEKADREAEAERMRLERIELERMKAEQAEAQKKIDEQNAKLEAEKQRIEDERKRIENERIARESQEARELELKKAREEAAETARLKAIKEQQDAEDKKNAEAEKARIAAEKKAARQPDRKKIQAYVDSIKAIAVPELKTNEALIVMTTITDLVAKLENYAVKQIETL